MVAMDSMATSLRGDTIGTEGPIDRRRQNRIDFAIHDVTTKAFASLPPTLDTTFPNAQREAWRRSIVLGNDAD